MRSLDEIRYDYADDLNAVYDWSNEQYELMFSAYFSIVDELYGRMQSRSHPITDEELESILIRLPIELTYASETLNLIKLEYETIKLKNKEKRYEAKQRIVESCDTSGTKLSASDLKEAVELESVEGDLLVLLYNSLISRVESKLSFSRELIMGAKKIFDGRRSAEGANPINPVTPKNDNIPDYDLSSNKKYIK